MGKHFSKLLMLLMLVANISYASGDDDLTSEAGDIPKSKTYIQQAWEVYEAVGDIGNALDILGNNDYSASLFLSSAHFLTGVAGSYQFFREWFPLYMGAETAEWAAPMASVAFASGRMLWAANQPVSSIPGTAVLGGLAWGYYTPS